jgi:hypothetical protein
MLNQISSVSSLTKIYFKPLLYEADMPQKHSDKVAYVKMYLLFSKVLFYASLIFFAKPKRQL